jgi:hypothetical protein
MVHYRLPATLLDQQIRKLQDHLHEGLLAEWVLGENDCQCYGRAEKTASKAGFKPEVFKGDTNYKDVLHDDKYAVQSFFGTGDQKTISGAYNEVSLHLVFFIHLGLLKRNTQEDSPHRTALEADEDIQRIMGEDMHGFTLERIVTGTEVLAEYTAVTKEKVLTKFDMHPFHTVRLQGTLRYQKPTY